MDRTLPDRRCLTYQTPVLDRDVEVTGHPVADLWVSSDRADGDFFVYLTDVDESGRSLYVTEGQLRAGWTKTYPGDDQVRRGHRLRVAVAGADAGNFEMNPYLCAGNRPEDCPKTTVSIHHTKAWPSRIELPVIPGGR